MLICERCWVRTVSSSDVILCGCPGRFEWGIMCSGKYARQKSLLHGDSVICISVMQIQQSETQKCPFTYFVVHDDKGRALEYVLRALWNEWNIKPLFSRPTINILLISTLCENSLLSLYIRELYNNYKQQRKAHAFAYNLNALFVATNGKFHIFRYCSSSTLYQPVSRSCFQLIGPSDVIGYSDGLPG